MKDNNSNLDNLNVLIFEVGGRKQRIGLNIFKTQEILTLEQCNKLPNSTKEVLGLMNLRGEVVTVFDLSYTLFQEQTDLSKHSTIIICEHNSQKFALLVHNVLNIVEIEWKNLKSLQEIMRAEQTYFESLFESDGKLITILNLESFFSKYFQAHNTTEYSKHQFKINPQHYRILILEDSETTKQVLKQTLDIYNIQYYICTNGIDGLEHLKKNKNYSLILSDIEMPKMDGFSFLRELEKTGIQIPVVMYSSLSDPVTIEKSKNLGAKHFITKYNPKKILEAIETFSLNMH